MAAEDGGAIVAFRITVDPTTGEAAIKQFSDFVVKENEKMAGSATTTAKKTEEGQKKTQKTHKETGAALEDTTKKAKSFWNSIFPGGRKLDEMDSQFRKAGQGLTQFTGQMGGLATVLMATGIGAGAAYIASSVARMSKDIILAMKDVIDTGQQFDDVMRGWKSLAEKKGLDPAGTLEGMRIATKGLVTELRLMETANEAVILGLPVTSEGLAKVAEKAMLLGRTMGVSVDYALKSLVIGIGRQSRLWLDNIGIIVKAEAAYDHLAKQLGRSRDTLTALEQKQAFYIAAMDAADIASRGLTFMTDSLSMSLTRVGVSMQNFVAQGGAVLNRLLGFPTIAQAVASSIDKLGALLQSLLPAAKAFGAVLDDWVSAGLADVIDSVNRFNDVMDDWKFKLDLWSLMAHGLAMRIREMGTSAHSNLPFIQAAKDKWQEYFDWFADKIDKMGVIDKLSQDVTSPTPARELLKLPAASARVGEVNTDAQALNETFALMEQASNSDFGKGLGSLISDLERAKKSGDAYVKVMGEATGPISKVTVNAELTLGLKALGEATKVIGVESKEITPHIATLQAALDSLKKTGTVTPEAFKAIQAELSSVLPVVKKAYETLASPGEVAVFAAQTDDLMKKIVKGKVEIGEFNASMATSFEAGDMGKQAQKIIDNIALLRAGMNTAGVDAGVFRVAIKEQQDALDKLHVKMGLLPEDYKQARNEIERFLKSFVSQGPELDSVLTQINYFLAGLEKVPEQYDLQQIAIDRYGRYLIDIEERWKAGTLSLGEYKLQVVQFGQAISKLQDASPEPLKLTPAAETAVGTYQFNKNPLTEKEQKAPEIKVPADIKELAGLKYDVEALTISYELLNGVTDAGTLNSDLYSRALKNLMEAMNGASQSGHTFGKEIDDLVQSYISLENASQSVKDLINNRNLITQLAADYQNLSSITDTNVTSSAAWVLQMDDVYARMYMLKQAGVDIAAAFGEAAAKQADFVVGMQRFQELAAVSEGGAALIASLRDTNGMLSDSDKMWTSAYASMAAFGQVAEAVGGKQDKMAKRMKKIQAGMLAVTGIVGIFEGAVKVGQGLPYNYPVIAAGIVQIAAGAAALAQAKAMGASESAGSPSKSSSGGADYTAAVRTPGLNNNPANTGTTPVVAYPSEVDGVGAVKRGAGGTTNITVQALDSQSLTQFLGVPSNRRVVANAVVAHVGGL